MSRRRLSNTAHIHVEAGETASIRPGFAGAGTSQAGGGMKNKNSAVPDPVTGGGAPDQVPGSEMHDKILALSVLTVGRSSERRFSGH